MYNFSYRMKNIDTPMSNPNELNIGSSRPPGTCVSWEEAKKRYGEIQGNEEQIERIWRENDAEAYDYFWQCLLSF